MESRASMEIAQGSKRQMVQIYIAATENDAHAPTGKDLPMA